VIVAVYGSNGAVAIEAFTLTATKFEPTPTAIPPTQVPNGWYQKSVKPDYEIVLVSSTSFDSKYRIVGENVSDIWERYKFYVSLTTISGTPAGGPTVESLPIPPSGKFTMDFTVSDLYEYAVLKVETNNVTVAIPDAAIKISALVRLQHTPIIDVVFDPLPLPHTECITPDCGDPDATILYIENTGDANARLCMIGLPMDQNDSIFWNVDL